MEIGNRERVRWVDEHEDMQEVTHILYSDSNSPSQQV